MITLLPRRTGASRLLLALAIPLALAALFPTLYLALRAAQVPPNEAAAYLMRSGTLRVIGRSVLLVSTVSLAAAAIGIPAAWLTVRTDLRARRLWTIVLTVPLVIPSYVGALALVSAFGQRGFVQGWLAPLGVARIPSIYGFWGAWLSITLLSYPYVFLSVRAGLKGLDPALEEASRTLGRPAWETFRRVTVPQLAPAIMAGVLLVALYTLSDFGAVAIMQYNVFTRAIYLRLSLDLETAALLSMVLIALSIAILALANATERRGSYYAQRSARAPRRVTLGRWQWVAQAFVALIALGALIAPLGVLGYWLVNGLQQGETLRDVLIPLQRSIRAAALAALACGVLALPFIVLQVRYPSRLSQMLARSVYLGYALPGVVVALAFVFVGARVLGALKTWFGMTDYRSLGLLIAAYIVRFIPQALGPARAGLLQVNPHLEESALTLGRSRPRVFWSITLPLMRPGLVAGVALVFLTVMKELPVTLLLAPSGYTTLATRIWSASSESFYARAAAPALVLVLISALSLVYILDDDD